MTVRGISPVPARPKHALRWAASIIRPSRLATARPSRRAFSAASTMRRAAFLFRGSWGKGSVHDSDLARVNRETAGGTQRAGLARSSFEALQVSIVRDRVRQDQRRSPGGPRRLYHLKGSRKQRLGRERNSHVGRVVLDPKSQSGSRWRGLGIRERFDPVTKTFSKRGQQHGVSGQDRRPRRLSRRRLWQNDPGACGVAGEVL